MLRQSQEEYIQTQWRSAQLSPKITSKLNKILLSICILTCPCPTISGHWNSVDSCARIKVDISSAT